VTAATGWKEQRRSIMQVLMARCVGSFVEEKENTLAWHYRNTQADLGFIRSRELINTLVQFTNNTWLQVLDGNKVVEVRLAGVDKGTTALKVVNRLAPDFVLCIGDDTTDEDMFKAMEHTGITIKVGSGGTAAHYNLLSQQEVIPFLQQFVTRVTEGVG
jgi:trehalose 6-phosphate synthase/phosphatase